MPWFRLDDSFDTHPKVLAAGNEAVGLYIRCGTYAARNLTDGYIGKDIVTLYGDENLAATLVRVRLWHRARGGWTIHDFLDYNPSREEVLAKRRVRAEAGRLGGLASGKTRSKNEANGSGLLEPPTRPDPSMAGVPTDGARASPRPVENPKPHSSKLNGAATRQPPPMTEVLADLAAKDAAASTPRGRHAKENP